MEEFFVGSLSGDHVVRENAYNHLKNCEKLPGFAMELIKVYKNSTDDARTLSLIMLKNTVNRSWIVKDRLTDGNKEEIKAFLLENLQTTGKCKNLVMEAIWVINKYEYIDTWKNLETYFTIVQNTSDFFQLLHSVIKIQLKKGSVRAKNSIKLLYSKISEILNLHLNSIGPTYLEKAMIKFISLSGTSADISFLLKRLEIYLEQEVYQSYANILLKGLCSFVIKIPGIIKEYIPILLNTYLKILHFLKPTSETNKITLDLVFLGMREILLKFPEFHYILTEKSELLLKKTLETELDERWEMWNNGDFSSFLENTSETDDETTRKFQESLLQSFPNLLATIQSLMSENLEFLQIHTICNLFCILPKFPNLFQESDYKKVISWLGSFRLEGIFKLVILRDSLMLTRKWLPILTDIKFVYSLLQLIKSSTNDPVILYECCLTLKQMTYANIDSQTMCQAIEDFSVVALELIPIVQAPQSVWHLITLISNMIECNNSDERVIEALGNLGLRSLLVDNNPMVMISVGDMLQKLILKFPGNFSVNQAVSLHLLTRIQRKDKQVIPLWLTFLMNFQGEIQIIEKLLIGLDEISIKNRGLKIKILEEYLLIYFENNCATQIGQFVIDRCEEYCKLTGQADEDYLTLELIFCVVRVWTIDKSYIMCEVSKYLTLEPLDIYNTLCIQYSLLIIASILLQNPELYTNLHLDIWFKKMDLLTTHNHLLLNSRAIQRVLPYSSAIFSEHPQEISKFSDSYSNSQPVEEKLSRKCFVGGTGVSDRYNYYLFRF